MSDEIPTAAARVAENLPAPADSNAPGAVNVDRDGNQVPTSEEAQETADQAASVGGRSGRAKSATSAAPSAPSIQTQE